MEGTLTYLQHAAGNAAVARSVSRGAGPGGVSSALLQRAETEGAASGGETTSAGWFGNPFGETEGEKNDTGESPGAVWRWLTWAGIGLADLIAGAIEWLGLEDYDISADLIRHYMSGRGADYHLAMPAEWSDEIAARYKRPGEFKNVSSYKWGIPDLKNSLGHFDLTVQSLGGSAMLYEVTDKYWFPYKENDKWEQGRHGFEVDFFGALPVEARQTINDGLAALGTWRNPGGFDEVFEVKKIGGAWTFLIPQQFLADSGVDYTIHSTFVAVPGRRSSDGEESEEGEEGWFGGWF